MQPSDLAPSGPSVLPAAQLARAVAEALYSREGVAEALAITLLDVGEGYARISMTVSRSMLNGHQTAHGGMIFTLADTAFAYACNSRNVTSVAAQASIIFLSPAHEGDVLIAEAREQAAFGRSGAFVVEVATEDGRSVASFHGLARTIGGPIIQLQETDLG